MTKDQVEWNQVWFNSVMKTQGVDGLTEASARAVLAEARLNAPVVSGAYRDSIHLKMVSTPYRNVYWVLTDSPYWAKIEHRTGNLLRALKGAMRG